MRDWQIGDRVRVSKDVFGGYEHSRGKATEAEYDELVGMTGSVIDNTYAFLGIMPVFKVQLDEFAVLPSGPTDILMLSDDEMEALDEPVSN